MPLEPEKSVILYHQGVVHKKLCHESRNLIFNSPLHFFFPLQPECFPSSLFLQCMYCVTYSCSTHPTTKLTQLMDVSYKACAGIPHTLHIICKYGTVFTAPS